LKISEINPYIRVAIPSVLRAGTKVAQRVIFDYELIYIESGKAVLCFNGVNHFCTEGDFILLRPGIPHSFDCSFGDLSQPHGHFDVTYFPDSEAVPISFKDANEFTERERTMLRPDVFHMNRSPFVSFKSREEALELFYDIIRADAPSRLYRKARMTALLDMLITDNFPTFFDEREDDYSVERQIKDYIDAGQGMTYSLDDFARQFSYSKYYLQRRFKSTYGKGLIEYKNEKRMTKAKELLKSDTVSGVSRRLGYSSIYVFSRAFKNRFGVSPVNASKADLKTKR